MRLGIYGRENRPVTKALHAGALACGFRAAYRSASDYGKGQLEDFDTVITYGLRGRGQWILDDYSAAGVPVLVCDFGYLKRINRGDEPDGFWQLGYGGLNKVPRDVPADRFEALGIECQDPGEGELVAVFGQVPCDASHGLDVTQHRKWAREAVKTLGAHWRPHPLDRTTELDAPRLDGDLADIWPRLSRIETLCSTAGLEALIAGVAAVAHMPERAVWGHLSGPRHPGREKVKVLCQRAAYGQWQRSEMESGEALAFAVENRHLWSELYG